MTFIAILHLTKANNIYNYYLNIMDKKDWIWMPHAGHFIAGDRCRFHLCTYIGKYLVSTIGELRWDSTSERINAQTKDLDWYNKNKDKKGDIWKGAYVDRFGWEELGPERTYETMVFKARKSENKCCPYEQVDGDSLDFDGYDNPDDAYAGHLKMCQKWSNSTSNQSE